MEALDRVVYYGHASKPTKHPIAEYEDPFIDWHPTQQMAWVQDRWHWGEMVWPTIFNRDAPYTWPMFDHTEMVLNSRGAVMVHCTGNPQKIWDRLEKRGDEKLEALRGNVTQIVDLFHHANESSHLPSFIHEIGNEVDIEAVVWTAAKRSVQAGKVLSVTPDVIGNVYDPEVLLVGEEAATEMAPGIPHMIPFQPYKTTSGFWMMPQLQPEVTAITNAFGHDGPTELYELWHALKRPAVVALGRSAESACKQQGLKCGTVPHPQFVRRFHKKKGTVYREALRKAASDGGDYYKLFKQ